MKHSTHPEDTMAEHTTFNDSPDDVITVPHRSNPLLRILELLIRALPYFLRRR